MFELPELPFANDALQPWTSAETFEYHHGKHHAGYVKKLNVAVLGNEFEGKQLDEVIKESRDTHQKIYNLSAQHFNHSFFWNCLAPEASVPEGKLIELIDRDFGSMEEFKSAFATAALGHFGSGWAWLVQTVEGTLEIRDYHDADTPAYSDVTPLMTLDVWEHAYYIDHRNDRAGFIEGFWNHVNWAFVSSNLNS
jgi:Fe-Mn family superoxide dismutase